MLKLSNKKEVIYILKQSLKKKVSKNLKHVKNKASAKK
jgi:hypothetical protein